MKKRYFISFLAIATFILSLMTMGTVQSSLAQHSPTPQAAEPTEQLMEFLFVQNSTRGTFNGKTLTLEGVGPTIFFTDRPERVAGQVPTAEFISHWDVGSDNFAADPPNAALSFRGAERAASAVIKLTNPKLEGSTLSYDVSVIEGSLPDSVGESSLFIDIYGRWAAAAAGAAVGASIARANSYYYHPPVYAPGPVYVAPRPIYVY